MTEQDAADALKMAHYINHQQSIIDALMLEFCPDRMTPEQISEWERNQVTMSCATCIFSKDESKCTAPRNVTKTDFDCDPVDRQFVIDTGECRPITLDELRQRSARSSADSGIARTAWAYRPKAKYTVAGKEYVGRDTNRICPSCKNDVTEEIRDDLGAHVAFYKDTKFHAMHCTFCGANWSYPIPD